MDKIIVTYINNFGESQPSLGIWADKNMSNIWLSRDRKEYPHIGLKRRKVSDILDNDRPEEIGLKNDIISRNLHKK